MKAGSAEQEEEVQLVRGRMIAAGSGRQQRV